LWDIDEDVHNPLLMSVVIF